MVLASPYPASHWTKNLARSAFYVTLILAPVRLRMMLQSRPSHAIYSDYTDFLLFLPDIALLVMLIAWGFAKRFDPKPLRFGPPLVWIPLAGLTASALISSASSVDGSLSLYHSVRLCLLFLFYLFIVNEQISIFNVAFAVGLQSMLQTAVAIPQSILQRSVGLQVLGEYLLDPTWSGVSIISDGATRILRAYGLSDHPNILGGCLAFSLLVLLTVYLRGNRKNSLLLGSVFVLISLALLMTFSRSAWLAFAAGSIFIVWFEARARGWGFIKSLALLFVCTIIVLLPFIARNSSYFGARFNAGSSFETVRSERGAVQERIFLIASANHIFSQHPLTGVGVSASPLALREEIPQLPETFNYQPPHFVLLTVGLETGMFGAIFYFLLMILPWVAFSRNVEARKNPHVIGAMGILLAVTIVGFFDYYTWFSTPGRIWQWLAWGLIAVSIESPSPLGRGVRGEGEIKSS
ncbi:MAG: O-antigen ligase family protein [Anaerolineae bacterium]|nr:O-antigen ligase family protein [Anaerolineae bacterium]MBL8104017.1 O-antigen ligase family protein [Anaerolineales bacterium]MCC7190782.1 O-antigen ligase family protein [Anaerolineales bacterium]